MLRAAIIKLLLLSLFCFSLTIQAADNLSADPEFDVEAATMSYIDRLDDEARERSDNYFEGGYWLQLWNLLYALAIAWLLLSKGLSHKMREFSERVFSKVFLQNMLYIAQYILLISILSFPLTIYQNYFREHAYDLSNMTLSAWLGEYAIGLIVNMLLMSVIFALIYKVIRKLANSWVTWASVLTISFMALMLLLSPIFIQPLFNDYQPLEEGQMRSEILSLARANSIPATDVYQVNASKQSKRISANVSGLGATTRISLNDNLLNRSDLAGVKAVMGHEMGHYALNHVVKLLIMFAILIYVGFSFVGWAFKRFNRPEWRINGIGDITGLPLFMMAFTLYFFLITPITNTIIRVNEVEADIYGLNAAREPDGFAEAILSLSEYRKVKPGYLEEIIFFDHPSAYNRIKMAMKWKKENPGVGADSKEIIPKREQPKE
jgi:STE24 endopeptidase